MKSVRRPFGLWVCSVRVGFNNSNENAIQDRKRKIDGHLPGERASRQRNMEPLRLVQLKLPGRCS